MAPAARRATSITAQRRSEPLPALICMGAIAPGMPTILLLAATALTVGALVAMFVIVHAGPDSSRVSPTWSADFLWARASMLFLLAAVPAAMCFHLSCAFHSELVAKRAESQLTSDLNTRARRINQQAQRVAVCVLKATPAHRPARRSGASSICARVRRCGTSTCHGFAEGKPNRPAMPVRSRERCARS